APERPRLVPADLAALSALTHDLPGPRCTGSSAALCNLDTLALHGQEDWVRCGRTLYGASALPGLTGASLGIMPAMSVQARILVVRRVAAGETVGYGAEFRANRNTCIGIVGIGYGHGVPRNLWQHGFVLAGRKGRRVPLAGRVAMDCLSIDLGPEPTEAPGDVVTLWGCAPGGGALPVEEAGQACDTIAAELLTGLTARLPLLVDWALLVAPVGGCHKPGEGRPRQTHQTRHNQCRRHSQAGKQPPDHDRPPHLPELVRPSQDAGCTGGPIALRLFACQHVGGLRGTGQATRHRQQQHGSGHAPQAGHPLHQQQSACTDQATRRNPLLPAA